MPHAVRHATLLLGLATLLAPADRVHAQTEPDPGTAEQPAAVETATCLGLVHDTAFDLWRSHAFVPASSDGSQPGLLLWSLAPTPAGDFAGGPRQQVLGTPLMRLCASRGPGSGALFAFGSTRGAPPQEPFELACVDGDGAPLWSRAEKRLEGAWRQPLYDGDGELTGLLLRQAPHLFALDLAGRQLWSAAAPRFSQDAATHPTSGSRVAVLENQRVSLSADGSPAGPSIGPGEAEGIIPALAPGVTLRTVRLVPADSRRPDLVVAGGSRERGSGFLARWRDDGGEVWRRELPRPCLDLAVLEPTDAPALLLTLDDQGQLTLRDLDGDQLWQDDTRQRLQRPPLPLLRLQAGTIDGVAWFTVDAGRQVLLYRWDGRR